MSGFWNVRDVKPSRLLQLPLDRRTIETRLDCMEGGMARGMGSKVYRAVIEAMAVKANKRDPENWIVKITHNGWFSVVRVAR